MQSGKEESFYKLEMSELTCPKHRTRCLGSKLHSRCGTSTEKAKEINVNQTDEKELQTDKTEEPESKEDNLA